MTLSRVALSNVASIPMHTIYFLLILLSGWILLVAVFIWMHLPERTVSELVRSIRTTR